MRITIIAIGKIGKSAAADMVADFVRRTPWDITIKEFEIKKPAQSSTLRKAQEAEKICSAIPENAAVIALDEGGKNFSSRQFAEKIDGFQTAGFSQIAFIIGGADGLDDTIKQKADITIAFGTLTWPHMMVRILLAEQIYRVWSILNNHPYHRD